MQGRLENSNNNKRTGYSLPVIKKSKTNSSNNAEQNNRLPNDDISKKKRKGKKKFDSQKKSHEGQTVWTAEDSFPDRYSDSDEEKLIKRRKSSSKNNGQESNSNNSKRSKQKNPYDSYDSNAKYSRLSRNNSTSFRQNRRNDSSSRSSSRELILEEEGNGLSLDYNIVAEKVTFLMSNLNQKNTFEDIDAKGEITMLELTGLKMLTLAINRDKNIAAYEGSKQIMDDFLFAAIGNIRLNNFIKKNRQLLIEEDISNDALDLMCSYTYGTRNMAEINQMLPDSNEDLNNQTSLDYFKVNKLTPKQFGLLIDYCKALEVFKPLSKQKFFIEKDLSNQDLSIKNIFHTGNIIVPQVHELKNSFNINFSEQEEPILLFEDGKRRFDVKGDDRNGQKFVNNFVKYRHTGKLIDTYDSTTFDFKKTVSHLPREFRLDAIDLKRSVYADMYKFDITALIDESKIPKGCSKDEWNKNVSKAFKNVTDKFYTSNCTPFPHVRSQSKILEFLGFLASILPFGYRKIWGKNDFTDIHQKMSTTYYDGTDSTTMLCSEFTAKCLIANIVELNKNLNATVDDKRSVDDVDVNNMTWYIEIPFSESEALGRMLPDRLHKILNERGCLIKFESSVLKDYIKQGSHVKRVEEHSRQSENLEL